MKKILLFLFVALSTLLISCNSDINQAKDIVSDETINKLVTECLLSQSRLSNSKLPAFEEHVLVGTKVKDDSIIAYLTGYSTSYRIENNKAIPNSGGEFIGTLTIQKVKDQYVVSSYNFPLATNDAIKLFKGNLKTELKNVNKETLREKETEKAINYFRKNNIDTSQITGA